MAPTAKYQDYLAANVLHEGSIVSYRSLSRALKVHVNIAKQMLFDFYTTQNSKNPSSIHAHYLVCGTRKAVTPPKPNGTNTSNSQPQEGEDTMMLDSSFAMSSSLPDQDQEPLAAPVSATTITICAQEQLQHVQSLYEAITSVHVYSLEPGPLNNIHVLSDCNRKIASDSVSEDSLETWKTYGTIYNPNTKRRTTKRPPPRAPIAPTVQPTNAVKAAEKPASGDTKVEEVKKQTTASKATAPALKKESSNLFKSFAKSKPPEPKGEPSTADSPAAAMDSPMVDADDEEEEAEEIDESFALDQSEEARQKAEANRAAKAERDLKNRQMMEEDDGDSQVSKGEDAEMADSPNAGEDTPEAASGAASDNAEQAPQVKSEATGGGRVRGRRQVTKRKQTKDEEGWLVTKDELVWESFSEDEGEATAVGSKSATSKPAVVAASGPKGKAAGTAKPGQGNIMKFFGKKG